MPITTLNRMSVPVEGAGSNQALLMPKLSYRFRVIFENFGAGSDVRELTRQVVDVSRPTVNFETVTMDVYNSKIKIAGKHSWDAVTINLREDANSNIQQLVGQQLQRQFDFYEQSSAVSGNVYKFTTKIEILDGGNGRFDARVLDRYVLVGCFLTSANYNQLNYSTNDPVTISLTIDYDNAIQTDELGNTANAGVGSVVDRVEGSQATGGSGQVTLGQF